MTDFMIHFLICNLLISGMIALLFAVKKIWQNHLTSRAQYNLWLLPLCLMVFPFSSLSASTGSFPCFPRLREISGEPLRTILPLTRSAYRPHPPTG